MESILQKDHPVLREVAKEVPIPEIGTEKIRSIILNMSEAMSAQKDGVAIAAPQIGVNLRIFVVSGRLLRQADKSFKGDETNLVFINPEITRLSREKREVEEGCLSVRWLYGRVRRSTRVSLRAYNEKGEKVSRGASGVLAQIFQHEMDHLNGILFTDKCTDVWEMTEEEIRQLQNA